MTDQELEVLKHTAARARMLELVLLSLIARLSVDEPRIAAGISESVTNMLDIAIAEGLTIDANVTDQFLTQLTDL